MHRTMLITLTLVLVSLAGGCGYVPRGPLRQYGDAFNEARVAGERLLVVYDEARREHHGAEARADGAPDATHIETRLRAWEAAGAWHDAMAALASGRSHGQVTRSVDRLAGALQAFPIDSVSQAGVAAGPALGVAGVVLEQVQQLRDEARLGEAVLAAGPWMRTFHELMRDDAADLLRLRRATLINSRRQHLSHATDVLDLLAEALTGLPHETDPSLARIVARMRLAGAGASELSEALDAFGPPPGDRPVDANALLHADALLDELESHLAAAQRARRERGAFEELVNNYIAMLDQLQAAQAQLELAVRTGQRIDEAAVDLLGRAWRTRRAIEALEASRH